MEPSTTVVLPPERESSLRTIGHISYALHAIVAVGAVLPGAQAEVGAMGPHLYLCARDRRAPGSRTSLAHPQRDLRRHPLCRDAAAVAAVIVPGWLAWGVISIWFLYRACVAGSH